MKMKMKTNPTKKAPDVANANQYEELIIVPVEQHSPTYPLYQPSTSVLSNQTDAQRLLTDWLNDDESMGQC